MAAMLTYSDYIRDHDIVAALNLPDAPPHGVNAADWPGKPDGWQPGDDWPADGAWAHDEVLFIRTHQAFEVWFALILHELTSVVREATDLTGIAFEDPKLALRDANTAPPLDAAAWPRTAALLAERSARDPGAAAVLARVRTPGTCHVAAVFPSHFGESDAFHHALIRWYERIQRAAKALLTSVSFFDILATMPPANFLKFRGRLQPASGFGSTQFRELEYLLGLRELHAKKLQPDGGAGTDWPPLMAPTAATPSDQRNQSFHASQTEWGRKRIARRAATPSLRDVVYGVLNAAFVAASGHDGPERGLPNLRPEGVDYFFCNSLQHAIDDQYRGTGPHLDATGLQHLGMSIDSLNDALMHRETMTAAILESQKDLELFTEFLNACMTLDGALLQWRDRHIRFVEAMIGTRVGTGGGGVRYLGTTVAQRPTYVTHAFPCLWQARSFVQH